MGWAGTHRVADVRGGTACVPGSRWPHLHSSLPRRPCGPCPATPAGYSKVGRRVRSRQKVDRAYGAKNAGGGKVPRERALVPAGAALRPWQREAPREA